MSHSESLVQSVCSGTQESALLLSSQVMFVCCWSREHILRTMDLGLGLVSSEILTASSVASITCPPLPRHHFIAHDNQRSERASALPKVTQLNGGGVIICR